MTAEDINSLIQQRREKLQKLREAGNAYPNHFKRDHLAAKLHERFDALDKETVDAQGYRVRIAGRIMTRRIMGKASFAHIQDMSGRIQIFLKRDALGDQYEAFKHWDIGDIVGVEGTVFKTKTGELSVRVERIELLTKSLRPLPNKWLGLTDQEQRYRMRYVDLIVNEASRKRFLLRSRIIQAIRRFLDEHGFLEVETPMMHPIPGGGDGTAFCDAPQCAGYAAVLADCP